MCEDFYILGLTNGKRRKMNILITVTYIERKRISKVREKNEGATKIKD